jgi:ubiquinone/menaquinone biosynthesis C-methylase UbiE
MAYPAKNAYQDELIAKDYDRARFSTIRGKIEDRLEKRAIAKALQLIGRQELIADVACGTGRITDFLASLQSRVLGGDISLPMIMAARQRLTGSANVLGFAQFSAESCPFRDKTFDVVVSIRLFGHLPPRVRCNVLKEMKRISRRYVVASFADKYTVRAFFRRRIQKIPMWFQVSEKELLAELEDLGMAVRKTFPIVRYFSETKIYVIDSRD